jgi:ankyrin repeat protein
VIEVAGDSLLDAAARGDATRVRKLLASGANPSEVDDLGRTALIVATIRGRYSAVKVITTLSVDLNHRDGQGRSALMWAAARGQRKILRLLLGRGASVAITAVRPR